MSIRYQSGLSHLLSSHRAALRGRVGLLAHPASVDESGVHASFRLRDALGRRLAALFGPEHGFYGRGGAGEELGDERHPAWDIPIHSLYGAHRKPTPEMLAGVDTLVFDLQDIGVRCYTFVTTLRYAMEACAESGKRMVVCDRPIPLPNVVDGPLPSPELESFVAGVPVPLVYGMTPGEAARYLQRALKLELDLRVIPMRGYVRQAGRGAWGPWISPSPGIRYWETAWTYPITVFSEALPALGCGRGGTEPFQVFTAEWMDAEKAALRFNRLGLPGLRAAPCWNPQPGLRFEVSQPDRIKPFEAVVNWLALLQRMVGVSELWEAPGTRPDWFDKLMGTSQVREALLRGERPDRILAQAHTEGARFRRARSLALLYRPRRAK
ncbi:MAG: DUF1343 domain-containing protein [Kiritimatiellae bacterium]|nr:DUF1343 domain-containing protein [Kiritimatiellia bacterium]MCO6400086.1 DUF1343 domain-containing protein [Verrucomicrobiota bacterium]